MRNCSSSSASNSPRNCCTATSRRRLSRRSSLPPAGGSRAILEERLRVGREGLCEGETASEKACKGCQKELHWKLLMRPRRGGEDDWAALLAGCIPAA